MLCIRCKGPCTTAYLCPRCEAHIPLEELLSVKAPPHTLYPGALARFRFHDVMARADFESRAVRIVELPLGTHFETHDGKHQKSVAFRDYDGPGEPYVIAESIPGARVTYHYPDTLVIPMEVDR